MTKYELIEKLIKLGYKLEPLLYCNDSDIITTAYNEELITYDFKFNDKKSN